LTNVLDKTFADLVSQLLENCKEQDVIMVPYEKLRSPQLQAEYWVQGRTFNDVQAKIHELKKTGAFFLSKCLENAVFKKGRIITNALPGCSWHQWGEAVDCYWLKDDKANWDLEAKDENNQNGYQVYAYEAKKLGMEAGLYWKNLIDGVHVQMQPFSSPLNIYSITEVDEVMKDLYS
jgi:hypothetical protein